MPICGPGGPLLLARPASLGKHRPGSIRRTSEQAGALEGFVPLGPWRQQARALERIRSQHVLFNPVRRPLCFFHRC